MLEDGEELITPEAADKKADLVMGAGRKTDG